MKFRVRLIVEVDEEANFLEAGDPRDCEVIKQFINDILYDIDDLDLEQCEVYNDD